MPCDHFSINVPPSSFESVITFLTTSLSHMGFKEIMRPAPHVVGMGESLPYMWITAVDTEGMSDEVQKRYFEAVHVAFTASDIKQVRQFYDQAVKAGGVDNGKPGRRAHYHPGYYGAFVRDPYCGINFEMVFHGCPQDEEVLRKMEEE